ncbi:RNA polymerase sigma factor [Psychroserpens burtonensis]|uniref:RNA polymerase sigma factor n=1 Tax=Psychroserpens burtonensis TaxID=49278 RepID=UPI0021C33733|nr:RNA polymerase sigma factor [Psychroserpens burtonensis]
MKAQSQLYKCYKDDLYLLCLKYCKNKEEAQDNLQDSFLEIFDKMKSYKGTGSFEGWMKRTTIHKAIDKYNKSKTVNIEINDVLLEDITINNEILESISLDDILNQIQELPTRYRMVFSLYELDQYAHKDIAELLHININTSKSNLHRTKRLLKQKRLDIHPLLSKTNINK